MTRIALPAVLVVALSTVACGARVADDTGAGSQNANGGANGVGGATATGSTTTTTPTGTPSTGGAGGAPTTTGGAGGAAAQCEPAPPSLEPGTPLHATSDEGAGACAGHTVASVLAAIHAAHPDLADVQTVWDHASFDGSFVYAFREPSGALALALARGAGDCPSGCIEHEYWYFEAGAGCAPALVGHLGKPPGEGCWEGQAMWGRPPPPDPASLCGASDAPEDISGTTTLHACGQAVDDCGGGNADVTTIAGPLGLTIAQDPANLATGTVTFTGTGQPAIDGRALAAIFTRRRFHAEEHVQNPGNCMETRDLTVDFDFEGHGAHRLDFFAVRVPDCAKPDDYCKVSLSATLFASP